MKKLISFIICAAMFAAMVLPFTVSADGMILWTDDFSVPRYDDWIWVNDGNPDDPISLFTVENGRLEGWREAVVHQSEYRPEYGAARAYGELVWQSDCMGFADGGGDSETHSMKLWWADYLNPYGFSAEDGGMDNGSIVYEFAYNFEDNTAELEITFRDEAEELIPADWESSHEVVASVTLPDSMASQMDESEPDVFTLGMRVWQGAIFCYYNGTPVLAYKTVRGAVTGTEARSPVLLINGGCYCAFDNVVVATPDYDLFNEGAIPTDVDAFLAAHPNVWVLGGNNQGGETPVTTGGNAVVTTNEKGEVVTTAPVTQIVKEVIEKVVHSTDAEGNDITEIETEIVEKTVTQAPQAATNNGGTSARNGGSQTGDMAIVVIAVMVVALGSAVVVKKATDRK